MADYLSAELTATCAVLGHCNGLDYDLDKDCLGKNVLSACDLDDVYY